MLPGSLQRVDSWAGEGVERMIRGHHRRRLRRLGRVAQLDPPQDGRLWSGDDPPPRPGCGLDVLVDGERALSAIAEALAGARSYVHIAGWHVDPGFRLTREPGASALRELLGELAERVEVRVLVWAGAPLGVFTPDRGEVRQVREELTRGTRVKCALDDKERPMHCHHEKLVIVDGAVAFVGGIDLTALGGDRFDTRAHPVRGRLAWHDACARLRGPAVADVVSHFESRWREVADDDAPAAAVQGPAAATAGDGTAAGAGRTTVQIVRTVPERLYEFRARGEFRILEAYVRALRAARTLVYLESQFLWSSQVVQILEGKLRDPPSEQFRVVVMLPAKPNNGADMTRGQLGVLAAADDGAGRFLATTIAARSGVASGPLYVHAKIGIVDDAWLTIGSANLNEHSFFNDTEMNLVTCDRDVARAVRHALWAEHLERGVDELAAAPAQVIDELWRPIAREQLERRARGEHPTHRLQELPGVSRRSMALLGPLQGLLVDG
jgi:phosphatidylserine/phosphatidylglycerophosphate/cardiolipin synthase-like enzyme